MRYFSAILMIFFVYSFSAVSEARIRNRKVKEAPRVCKVMDEDKFLSRDHKKVWGTLRHSVVIESSADVHNVTLLKDKGEKICQWKLEQWDSIRSENGLPDISEFRFYIDEYKEILYPYVKKADSSYFMLTIPIKACALGQQVTKEKLEIPKCDPPKKKAAPKKKRPANTKKKKTTTKK